MRFDASHEERAVFVVGGSVTTNDEAVAIDAGRMAVLTDDVVTIIATERSIVVLLGGDRLDAPRALEWNFVSTSREAIERARADRAAFPNARFPQVPGETESIPLRPRPRPEPTAL